MWICFALFFLPMKITVACTLKFDKIWTLSNIWSHILKHFVCLANDQTFLIPYYLKVYKNKRKHLRLRACLSSANSLQLIRVFPWRDTADGIFVICCSLVQAHSNGLAFRLLFHRFKTIFHRIKTVHCRDRNQQMQSKYRCSQSQGDAKSCSLTYKIKNISMWVCEAKREIQFLQEAHGQWKWRHSVKEILSRVCFTTAQFWAQPPNFGQQKNVFAYRTGKKLLPVFQSACKVQTLNKNLRYENFVLVTL